MPPFFFVVARQMPPASISKTITVPKPKTASPTPNAKKSATTTPHQTHWHTNIAQIVAFCAIIHYHSAHYPVPHRKTQPPILK